MPDVSYASFVTDVQPVLAARCSNPTTCHGREDRPFSIYARHAHRADPSDLYYDPPLSERELVANFDRSRSFAGAVGGLPLLLSKPLSEAAGGARHVGGDQFETRDEHEYRLVEEWVLED